MCVKCEADFVSHAVASSLSLSETDSGHKAAPKEAAVPDYTSVIWGEGVLARGWNPCAALFGEQAGGVCTSVWAHSYLQWGWGKAACAALLLLLLFGTKWRRLLWLHGLWPSRLVCPWDFLVRISGGGCHFLFQGVFQPRDDTHSSCNAGKYWATREAPVLTILGPFS